METYDTAENPRNRLLAAEQRLLTEGLPSYLDAIMAIQELRQNVYKRCHRVLSKELDNFARAIGVTLDATKIEEYADPDGISTLAVAECAWLGVEVPLQSAGTAYATLVCKKNDSLEERQIEVYVGIEINDRNLFDRVWEIVQREEPRTVSGYRGGIELYKPVPPDLIVSFDNILADLMREWSRLWQRVGVPLG